MGWLIDPRERTVFSYSSRGLPEVFDESEQQLPVPLFSSEIQLTIGELFGWLLE